MWLMKGSGKLERRQCTALLSIESTQTTIFTRKIIIRVGLSIIHTKLWKRATMKEKSQKISKITELCHNGPVGAYLRFTGWSGSGGAILTVTDRFKILVFSSVWNGRHCRARRTEGMTPAPVYPFRSLPQTSCGPEPYTLWLGVPGVTAAPDIFCRDLKDDQR